MKCIVSTDPLYERIGSIRRHHMISLRSKSRIKPRLPSPVHITNIDSSSRATCPLPPGDINRFPKCPLPPKGAPLPPRPPTLGLMRGDSITDHNYESLPSTFSVDSPEDTVYAHISTPEAGEAQSPPFIPDGGQLLSSSSHLPYLTYTHTTQAKEHTCSR